jgi:hypothetical protein
MERIDRSVEQELARGGGGHGAALHAITAAWPDVTGGSVARNAWPLRVGRDGTLHVATTSSTWALELDRLAPEILEKLTARIGEEAPAKLRFAVGPVPEPPAPEARGESLPPRPEVTPDMAAEAARAASEIEDPELRELALRAARAGLSKPPSDRRF